VEVGVLAQGNGGEWTNYGEQKRGASDGVQVCLQALLFAAKGGGDNIKVWLGGKADARQAEITGNGRFRLGAERHQTSGVTTGRLNAD
jgi:hypothetical protein